MLYDQKKHIQTFVKDSLKMIESTCFIFEYIINNLLSEIFRDDTLCKKIDLQWILNCINKKFKIIDYKKI